MPRSNRTCKFKNGDKVKHKKECHIHSMLTIEQVNVKPWIVTDASCGESEIEISGNFCGRDRDFRIYEKCFELVRERKVFKDSPFS